jgi:hypothetical protein
MIPHDYDVAYGSVLSGTNNTPHLDAGIYMFSKIKEMHTCVYEKIRGENNQKGK